MESDHAGLQPQTRSEPGQLPEIDDRSELKVRRTAPTPKNPPVGSDNSRIRSDHQTPANFLSEKTSKPNKNLFPLTAFRLQSHRSFYTGSRMVRPFVCHKTQSRLGRQPTMASISAKPAATANIQATTGARDVKNNQPATPPRRTAKTALMIRKCLALLLGMPGLLMACRTA
jgi:hypothetical protein